MKRSLAAMCVFTVLFAATLVSQGRASLVGTIKDSAGAVIANATVQLRAVPNGTTLAALSDSSGRYSFQNLSPGEYELRVDVAGFKSYRRTSLQLVAGRQVREDIILEVGSTSESVTVTGSPRSDQGQQGKGGKARAAESVSVYPQMQAVAPPPAQMARQEFVFGGIAGFGGRAYGVRRPTNTEEYGHWVENEFTSPQSDPLSTFGVDVDTASYSNIRRFLSEGRLPPNDSVRIEELINYFSYDYPLPERGKPVSLTTRVVTNPWNHQRQLLQIGLRTQPVATEDLPPSSLTFLVDVSGSMNSPDKLPLVKQALQMLVRQLRKQDRVSLVVYAGNSGVVLPPTNGDRSDVILDAIERLAAGGSTHGSAGIRLAYKMARDSFLKNGNNRVILATDGDFNVGVTSDEELVRLIEDERKSGVFLSVLGFGTGNLKDSKMEKLADHGNGTYAYVDSLAEARKIFVQEMGASIVTVAKDVKLQIEFNPARVKSYRLIGYENRMLRPEDFNDDTKDAGDLGAGHQVTALYEIVTDGSGEPGAGVDPLRYQTNAQPVRQDSHTQELAWVKLRYKDPQANSSQLMEWPIAAGITPFDSAPRDTRFAIAVAEYGLVLRRSKFAGNSSLSHALKTASDAVGPDLEGHRTAFLDLVRKAERFLR